MRRLIESGAYLNYSNSGRGAKSSSYGIGSGPTLLPPIVARGPIGQSCKKAMGIRVPPVRAF